MSQRLARSELDQIIAASSALPEPFAETNRVLLSPRWLNNRDQLKKIVTGQRYAPGDVIFQEGEQSDDCAYVICSGRVVAFKGDAQSPMAAESGSNRARATSAAVLSLLCRDRRRRLTRFQCNKKRMAHVSIAPHADRLTHIVTPRSA